MTAVYDLQNRPQIPHSLPPSYRLLCSHIAIPMAIILIGLNHFQIVSLALGKCSANANANANAMWCRSQGYSDAHVLAAFC